MARHRMRMRYREILKAQIRRPFVAVGNEEEIRLLFAAFGP